MISLTEASRRQNEASTPGNSTWLSANAGSGKTRVLTDRVARLLLQGADPQGILCLTFTKAAASEMQNRLFDRLGKWSMQDDASLRDALTGLGEAGPLDLNHARTLFARAIETPGGLKIQTIHAFCGALLRKFPIEAGVAPGFVEIDDAQRAELMQEALDHVADTAPEAFDAFAPLLSDKTISETLTTLISKKEGLGCLAALSDAKTALGLAQDADPLSTAFNGTEPDLMPRVLATLSAAKQGKTLETICAVFGGIDWTHPTEDDLSALGRLFLYASASGDNKIGDPKFNSIPPKKAQEDLGALLLPLQDFMQRVSDARRVEFAIRAAENTAALHAFAKLFLARYEDAKTLRGWLDFDDLILKARALLSDPSVAAWVLYRLDGGIDHVLIDEAQDTSPAQWDLIRLLTEEIGAGEGTRSDLARSFFVVGDKKQSIYSFQGAAPDAFDDMEAEFGEKLAQIGAPFQSRSLAFSFRSSAAILRTVDATFEMAGDAGFATDEKHRAFHGQKPGRVDLWPMIAPTASPEDPPWTDPVDRIPETHHTVTLANAVADRIAHMLDPRSPEMIPDGSDDAGYHLRPVRPGDIMILVQSRSTLFKELIRACKSRNLPIAGADRLRVGAELAVRDLMALLTFLATPEDSLSLAVALRSPLFGWSEQDLFTLAHHRTEPHLWERLRNQGDAHPNTLEMLVDLRNQIDFLRPYELFERILTRHSGRAKLLGRLGTEAEDGIDAILAQALAYEIADVPSLTGFLRWAQADDLEIKRQLESDANLIRVMTVHGAKGLEAPIVILPDCAARKSDVKDEILLSKEGPMWRVGAEDQPSAMTAVLETRKAADQRERQRLLYVAMTRAETWLIVAGAGKTSKDGSDWHSTVATGLDKVDATEFDHPAGVGLRLEHGVWALETKPETDAASAKSTLLEPYFTTPVATTPDREDPLSPSDLGGAKALPSELGQDEEIAKARGTYMHLMLEVASTHEPQARSDACRSVPPPPDMQPSVAEAALSEVLRVFETTALEWVFDPDGLSEAALAGQINGVPLHGIIDRLIISPDVVHIIDFKTNQAVPDTPNDCPEGLLRQMGAYARLAKDIYPDRNIETGILWTATPRFMSLPQNMVSDALARAPRLDGLRLST